MLLLGWVRRCGQWSRKPRGAIFLSGTFLIDGMRPPGACHRPGWRWVVRSGTLAVVGVVALDLGWGGRVGIGGGIAKTCG